jgi:hypothetical protein
MGIGAGGVSLPNDSPLTPGHPVRERRTSRLRRRRRRRALKAGIRQGRGGDLPERREGDREDRRLGRTPEDVAKTIDKVIKESQDAADQLVDLHRPEGDAGDTAKRFTEASGRS